MGDVFQKLPAGAPITAISRTAYNRMIDMLRWWLTQQDTTGPKAKRNVQQNTTILVKNATGDPVDFLAVLGIDDILYDPTDDEDQFKTQPVIEGAIPTVADHSGKWVVLTTGLADGEIGRAIIAGIASVRVYVNDPDDDHCDIIDVETVDGEDCYLGTGSGGAQILWMEDGEAETIVWALVRLGSTPTAPRLFQLNSDLSEYAYAYPTDENGAAIEDDDLLFLVHNTLGANWGYTGKKGVAIFEPTLGKWVVVSMQQPARWVAFSLATALEYTSDTVSAAVLSYWDGYSPEVDENGYIGLVNSGNMFAGDEGAFGLASGAGGLYHIVQIECPPPPE